MTNIQKKALIVDTDSHICSFLKIALKDKGFNVFTSATGLSGALLADEINPDIILLDPELPDIYAKDLIVLFRKNKDVPVIILSDKTSESDKVEAFAIGADDYLTKPFGLSELFARMNTALRHSMSYQKSIIFKTGNLTIDFDKREVRIQNELIKLTATEYALVCILAKSAGKVLTYQQLIKRIWGKNTSADTRRLHVNMANIRRKFSEPSGCPKYLLTENGVGYKMAIVK